MKIMALLFAIVFSLPTYSADFDIEQHCAKVAASVGGSYQIEQNCRNKARESKRVLENMSIPPEIERNCERIAASVGGSYTIMKHCIEREIAAKTNLR